MSLKPRRYFFIAGEASGDAHGAAVVAALRHLDPLSSCAGVAGPLLRQAGLFAFYDVQQLSVMGFSDVLPALPRLLKLFYSIKRTILRGGYDAVVFIDAPAFNLRMAQALRRAGYRGKLIHYISPSVWAHGRSRIATMAQTLDHLLTIFPFEQQCYEGSALPVTYVGNPTMERVLQHRYDEGWRAALGLPADKQIIALYPGSREGELRRHLPLMLQAAATALRHGEGAYHLAVSCSAERYADLIREAGQHCGIPWGSDATLTPASLCHYELMRGARCALAKSGTITLELALHGCPTVVSYRLSPFNRFMAQHVLRLSLPYYCLANIIMQRELFPEYIAQEADVATLGAALCRLRDDEAARRHCLEGCQALRTALGEASVSRKVATILRSIA